MPKKALFQDRNLTHLPLKTSNLLLPLRVATFFTQWNLSVAKNCWQEFKFQIPNSIFLIWNSCISEALLKDEFCSCAPTASPWVAPSCVPAFRVRPSPTVFWEKPQTLQGGQEKSHLSWAGDCEEIGKIVKCKTSRRRCRHRRNTGKVQTLSGWRQP